MPGKEKKLILPYLLDFTKLKKNDEVEIYICNALHKFASDAEYSGTDIIKQPIFGSETFINGKKVAKLSFGLPFFRFEKGSSPKITYINNTRFTFNIHYHGLNTVGSVDGTSMEIVFGPSTLLGCRVTFQFPEITNNQSLLWFHSHNMFTSMELIYGGIIGLLQIVDKQTKWLSKRFEYGDNQLLLAALDMDLTQTGTQTFANLVTDENRSSFSIINGISAVNWYNCNKNTPYVEMLYHETNKNLVKIDILNGSLNWRVFHLGVCDENMKIKPFYLVQTDGGLMNPIKLKMTYVRVASRVSILIDLNHFKNKKATLFFYDYDLTEVVDASPAFSDQPNNPLINGTYPEFNLANHTPFPTPIPDPNEENQQGIYTKLDYPKINLLEQTKQILDNGAIVPPPKFYIKPFLNVKLNKNSHKKDRKMSLNNTIKKIRKTVFGDKNYKEFKDLIQKQCFEYDSKINYTSLLNEKYFYNLPEFDQNLPTRNLLLFPEDETNSISGGNINGTTEYIDGANRIMVDLWNSAELDLDWALKQYAMSPNNYKPPILPSSKFRIYKTNDEFSNTAMISNDTLKIEIYNSEIRYGDFSQIPLATVTIILPPTSLCGLLNIQQWIDIINLAFLNTEIIIEGQLVNVSTILECDWSFFPYAFNFLYEKTIYIKSAVIKTNNKSGFWIRLLGRWPLLQFFGKPLTGDTLDSSLNEGLRERQKNIKNKFACKRSNVNKNNKFDYESAIHNRSQYSRCDEIEIYGIYDAEIQQIFPKYATHDGEVQLPIACMKRDAELIIFPQQTYIGLYDGYLNDNLNSFSVKKKSSEIWIYTNGDTTDAHSLHFHLTSGFAIPHSNLNSPGLVSCRRGADPLLYSRDIYQIGPQQIVSFFLTWPNYSSQATTKSPNIPCIGGVIHCHFLQHNDSNSMIIQYYVDPADDECIEQNQNIMKNNNITKNNNNCCKKN